MLETLYKEALDRKKNPKEGSYTNYLFDKGLDKILKKVGEEATEVVIGAKNADKETLFLTPLSSFSFSPCNFEKAGKRTEETKEERVAEISFGNISPRL